MIHEDRLDGHIVICRRCSQGGIFKLDGLKHLEVRIVRCRQCGQRMSIIGMLRVVAAFLAELPDDDEK